MSATGLYVKACRCLYSNAGSKSWEELLALLPQLRTALSCRVCRGLIVDPQSSKYCQHYVCRGCLKKKRALNPGCKWCLDWSKLQQSDRQVRVVLACYKLLCKTIRSSHFYKNTAKDAKMDMLLREAISNSDVLPDSNNVPWNESGIWQEKLENVANGLGSRDTQKTCARENVTKNVNKIKRGRKPGKGKTSRCYKRTSFNDNIEHSTKVTENCMEQHHLQSDSVNPTNEEPENDKCKMNDNQDNTYPEPGEPKSSVVEGEINNNETKQSSEDNSTVMSGKMKSCSTSRNAYLAQNHEQVNYKKKRNLRQMVSIGFKNRRDGTCNRAADHGWKQRPRKRYKVDLDIYNKKCIAIQT